MHFRLFVLAYSPVLLKKSETLIPSKLLSSNNFHSVSCINARRSLRIVDIRISVYLYWNIMLNPCFHFRLNLPVRTQCQVLDRCSYWYDFSRNSNYYYIDCTYFIWIRLRKCLDRLHGTCNRALQWNDLLWYCNCHASCQIRDGRIHFVLCSPICRHHENVILLAPDLGQEQVIYSFLSVMSLIY